MPVATGAPSTTRLRRRSGIFAITSVAFPGAAEAVRQSGRATDVAVVGLATPNGMRQYVKDGTVETVLRSTPDLEVEVVESSCCGMAGAFGYGKETIEVSRQMAELDLLPAVRAADGDTLIVADGTSCRHQIHDGAGREAIHVARVLEQALAA